MNIIEQLKSWAIAEQENARALSQYYHDSGKRELAQTYIGATVAFSCMIKKLELHLKTSNESKQRECANSANAMKGEVPLVSDLIFTETAGAFPGATGAERQNEQTKEHFFCHNKHLMGKAGCEAQCWSCANPA